MLKVQGIGNLGSKPEMRYTASGVAVTNFPVAFNRRWTNQDGSKGEETTWIRATAWRRLAEVCNEYLDKGRQVYIEGRLNPDPETGGPKVFKRNNGEPGASYEVTITNIQFLGSGNGGNGAPPEEEAAEIPF